MVLSGYVSFSGAAFPFPLFSAQQGEKYSSEIQTAVSTIIFFTGIEMFAIGFRWSHNLWHGHVVRHATVVHAFINME